MPRITLQHTLVAALAASVLAATPAMAKPVDRVDRYESPTSSLAGTVSHQDLRGEHARDAARLAEQPQDLRGEHARDAARGVVVGSPTRIQPVPVSEPKAIASPESDSGDDIWLVLGIALGASGVIGGSAVVATRRARRVPA